jgi:hypothetical protein
VTRGADNKRGTEMSPEVDPAVGVVAASQGWMCKDHERRLRDIETAVNSGRVLLTVIIFEIPVVVAVFGALARIFWR